MGQRNKTQSEKIQLERLDFLLDALKEDSVQYKNLQVDNSEIEKTKCGAFSDECSYAAEYFG